MGGRTGVVVGWRGAGRESDVSRVVLSSGEVTLAGWRRGTRVTAQANRAPACATAVTDIQSGCAALSLFCRPAGEDRRRPAPARHRCLTEWSARRLLAC
jgi:hypothetical protein